MIIGQKNLMSYINVIINNFPRFSIFVGDEGSGKKLICKYICDKLGLKIVKCNQKIDEVRDVIKLAYEQTNPICYLLSDADSMSVNAKNLLLKVTEEPPKMSYFMITLKTKDGMLPTILSRANVFFLDDYSLEDLVEYRRYKKYNDANDKIMLEVCSTTGDVDRLFKSDIPGFNFYANNIVENIDKVDSGNIFKIGSHLKLKSTDDGYDPILMFKMIRKLFLKKGVTSKDKKYLRASKVTSNYMMDLNSSVLSKQATVDMWIMDVRKSLRE